MKQGLIEDLWIGNTLDGINGTTRSMAKDILQHAAQYLLRFPSQGHRPIPHMVYFCICREGYSVKGYPSLLLYVYQIFHHRSKFMSQELDTTMTIAELKSILLTIKDDKNRPLFKEVDTSSLDKESTEQLKLLSENNYCLMLYSEYHTKDPDDLSADVWTIWLQLTNVSATVSKYNQTRQHFQALSIQMVHNLTDKYLDILNNMTEAELKKIIYTLQQSTHAIINFTNETVNIENSTLLNKTEDIKVLLRQFVRYAFMINLLVMRNLLTELELHAKSLMDLRIIKLATLPESFIAEKHEDKPEVLSQLLEDMNNNVASELAVEYLRYLNDLINIPGIVILDIAEWQTSANALRAYLKLFKQSKDDDRLTILFYDSGISSPEDKSLLYKNQKFMEMYYIFSKRDTPYEQSEWKQAIKDTVKYQETVYSLVAQALGRDDTLKEEKEQKDE